MTQLSRMQKNHSATPENDYDETLLVDDSILQSDEEHIVLRSKSKLEKYNTFLNRVIIVSSILLVGIFIAMIFF